MNNPQPPWRRGDKIRADRLTAADDMRRSNEVAAPAGATVSRGRFGTFVTERGAAADRTAVAVITTGCTARTGTSPAFTFGQGQALLLAVDSAGVTSSTGRTITIYNDLETAIPAAAKPVILLWVNGLPFVIVADC